jgi:hypothetical protein
MEWFFWGYSIHIGQGKYPLKWRFDRVGDTAWILQFGRVALTRRV